MKKLSEKAATEKAVKDHEADFEAGDPLAAWFAIRELAGPHGAKVKLPRWLHYYLETVALAVEATARRHGDSVQHDHKALGIIAVAMGLDASEAGWAAEFVGQSLGPDAGNLAPELTRRLIAEAERRRKRAAQAKAAQVTSLGALFGVN